MWLPSLNVQRIKMESVYLCLMGDDTGKKNIFTSKSCGVGFSWEMALSKAQSEFVEREAFRRSGFFSSTGFSAYPYVFSKKKARWRCRRNAYLEMLERYAWPEWFSQLDISYSYSDEILRKNQEFFQEMRKDVDILHIHKVVPALQDGSVSMVILYAETEYGLVCASAVKETEEAAEENALKELYMHSIGLYRMKEDRIPPKSIYEKRVLWISGQKSRLENRLKHKGFKKITVPFPIKYQDIPTKYSDAYVVQRCSFEGYDKEFLTEKNEMYI